MQENYLFITLPFICTKCVHHFYIVRIDFLECAVNNENGNDDGNDYPIAIDEEIFGPKITMIIGPSATFGMAFRTTRYGSSTRARSGIHQRKVAIMAPSTVPRMKPTPVSSNVVHMWTQSEPSIHLLRKRSQMLEGELKSKGSIHSFASDFP